MADDRTAEPSDAAAWEAIAADLSATLEPRTRVLRPIARGGMGMVFLARDLLLERMVAIKVLAPELAPDEVARRRFTFEAQAAAAVGHAHVLGIFSVGETTVLHAPYFVMQYVDGRPLHEAFPPGRPAPLVTALRIIGEVASALEAAHARQVVHRDIKPSNVMIERESGRTMVVDFGISSGLAPLARDARITGTGLYVGTPAFTSPEQASGEQATGRSDVYSLGCLAFELLAGRPLFVESTPVAMIAAHIKDTPPTFASVRPDMDPAVASLLDRCLSKGPDQRPSAAEIVRALLPDGGEEVEWPPLGVSTTETVPLRDDRAFAGWIWSGTLLTLAMLVSLSGYAGIVGGYGIDWSGTVVGATGIATALLLPVLLGRMVRVLRARRRFTRRVAAAGVSGAEARLLAAVDPAVARAILNRRGRFAALEPADATARAARLLRLDAAMQLACAAAILPWIVAFLVAPRSLLAGVVFAVLPFGVWWRLRTRRDAALGSTTDERARVTRGGSPGPAVVWGERRPIHLFDGRSGWLRAATVGLLPIAAGGTIALGLVVWHAWNNYWIGLKYVEAANALVRQSLASNSTTSAGARSGPRLDSLFELIAGPVLPAADAERRAVRAALIAAIARDRQRVRAGPDHWNDALPSLPTFDRAALDSYVVRAVEDSIANALLSRPDRAQVQRHRAALERVAGRPVLDAALAQARVDGTTMHWWLDSTAVDSLVPAAVTGMPWTLTTRISRGLLTRALLAWGDADPPRARAALRDFATFARAITVNTGGIGARIAEFNLRIASVLYDSVGTMTPTADLTSSLTVRELQLQLRLLDLSVAAYFPLEIAFGRDDEAQRIASDGGLPRHMRAAFVRHWTSFACRSPVAPISGVSPRDSIAAIRVYDALADIDANRVIRQSVLRGIQAFNESPSRIGYRWGWRQPLFFFDWIPLLGPAASRTLICMRRDQW